MFKSRGRKNSKSFAGWQIVVALIAAGTFAIAITTNCLAAEPQDNQNKGLDVRSSVGDLHIGSDADAGKTGLPVYPGAHIKSDDASKNAVNIGLLTEAFGLKLIVANYDSNDDPAKVIDFYRSKLKKYGSVLECHTGEHNRGFHADTDDDDKGQASKALRCEGDNSGPVTELKAGTEENQHIVAIKPGDSGKGSTFALVYVRARGKQSDI